MFFDIKKKLNLDTWENAGMITEEDEKKVINYDVVGNNGETGRHHKDKRKGFDFHVTASWQNEAIICRVS